MRKANQDEMFMSTLMVIDDVPGNNPEEASKNAEQFIQRASEGIAPWR